MSTEQEFNCVFCKESFDNKEDLQIHFRKHADPQFNKKGRPNVLPGVSEKAKDEVELVSCDVCSATFPTISKAITHKHKVHPSHDAKHFCPWCGKLFTMKHLYNKHLQSTHEGMERLDENNFHCDPCNVDFYIPPAMLYHNKFFHRQDTDLPAIGLSKKLRLYNQEALQIYYCAFCGEEYENKVNLHTHMGDDHSDENQRPEEVLRCPLCEAVFYHLDAYEVHLTFHSIDDLYSERNEMLNDVTEFSLETVAPIMEKVENFVEDGESNLNEVGINQMLELSMEEPNDSVSKKSKKHKKHKKSKKSAITLDEFLNMNKDVFGEGLDFQGIEEVPTRAVAKQLKNNKKLNQATTSATKNELDKLKKQGIVVKKKLATNPNKLTSSNPMKDLPKAIKVAQAASFRKPQNVTEPSLHSSNDVLSKLLNQNNSQIKIVKKSTQENVGVDEKKTEFSAAVEEEKVTSNNMDIEEAHNMDTEEQIRENSDTEETENLPQNDKEVNDEIFHEPRVASKPESPHSQSEEVHESPNANLKHAEKEDSHEENADSARMDETNEENNEFSKETVETDAKDDDDDDADHPLLDDKFQEIKTSHQLVTVKQPLNVLKHLSHLTVKPMSLNKDTVNDKNSNKTEFDKIDNMKTENESLINASKQNPIIQISQNESTSKHVDALKTLSKNITITPRGQINENSNKNSSINHSEDEDNDIDDETNTQSKNIAHNKVLNKTPLKQYADSNQAIQSPKSCETPTKDEDMRKQSSINLLKHLTNVTAKPIPKSVNQPNVKSQPTATNRNIVRKPFNKEINEEIEIFNIDDSDSDDANSKELTKNETNLKPTNMSTPKTENKLNAVNAPNSVEPKKNIKQSLDVIKNLSKCITIKSTNQQMHEDETQTVIKCEKMTYDEDEDFYSDDDDGAAENVNANMTNNKLNNNQQFVNQKNLAIKHALKNLSKNITVKSRNSSPSQSVKSQDQNSQDSNTGVKEDSDSDSCSGNIKITEMDNVSEEENNMEKNKKEENPIVQSPHDSGSENDFNEDEDSDIESKLKASTLRKIYDSKNATCLNNLMSKNITIKSLNEKTDKDRNATQDNPESSQMALKLYNPNTSRNSTIKLPTKIQPAGNVHGRANESFNQKVMTSNHQTNTVNKEVTVKTIQNKTVIEEITTTVTKTIRTVNQTVKQECVSQSAMAMRKVQGSNINQSRGLQGTSVRLTSPAGPRFRNPTPVASKNIVGTTVKSCGPILPVRSGPLQRPPRLPIIKKAPVQSPQVPKPVQPVKMSPKAVNKRHSDESSGHFSCFKKPKESLIPVSDVPTITEGESRLNFSSASHMSKSNTVSMIKTVKGNSVVTSTQMKSEMSASQQLSRLSNVSGLRVVKTSQTKTQHEKSENTSNHHTLEAIEKLKRQGLLVKKPRLDVSEDSEHSNPDDENVGYSSAEDDCN